ncbi:MAG TPA: hypothetical protein VFT43_01855, partial [Candidatus Polarisedimenticolia bacterium]|nr:hypothetical protein [Candidatus Polarisedimenticolia bacterium]
MNDRIEFHPRLVEEAVWAALRGRPEAPAFHRERDPLYEAPDPEERDRLFARLFASWFVRLGLGEPVQESLREQEAALAPVGRVLLGPAISVDREAAELYVAGPESRSVLVAIRPTTLVDRERALEFMRRELFHVADMLDPLFAYEPRLPGEAAGPAQDRLLQDRYRVLWDCSIDARLLALGHLREETLTRRLAEFRRAFACLGESAEDCFRRVVASSRPTHPEIVALVRDPEAFFGLSDASLRLRNRCALCGFPTSVFDPLPERFGGPVRDAILSEFPGWRADHGVCPQ